MMDRPEYLFTQVAAVPFLREKEETRLVLISSRRSGRWGVPKGVIDPGHTAREIAAQEAWEEAGLEGVVGDEVVGRFSYPKWGGVCQVSVYLLAVTALLPTWPEQDFRQRRVVPVPEALGLISLPALGDIVWRCFG